MALVLVGFGFKISAAPLHFWAPDVYEGAPTPVAGFLSTASKAAGFIVLMRFFLAVFPPAEPVWTTLISILAAVTMTVGNLIALAQKNIKRLLAYSSIAHAGYALVGLVAVNELGANGVIFYLGAYLLTNMAAFGAVAAFSRIVGTDDIAAYAGLSRRAPYLALVLLIAILSLSGMPPLAGFVAKIWVFAAAVQRGLIWLVVVGVLNSIIGLYYYLKVLNVIYHYRSEDEAKPLPVSAPHAIALALLVAGILLVGTAFAPFFDMGGAAAAGLF
jgi:NADH-quinone oxidoreductase subunit N